MTKGEPRPPQRHQGPPPCPACGGTGQISFFQGESRFLLTTEECPNCFGLGHLLPGKDADDSKEKDQSR